MRKALLVLVGALILSAVPAKAQAIALQANGTPHGMDSTWTASTPGSNPLAGYLLYRCVGASSACPVGTATLWTQLNTNPVTVLTYLDPASDGFTNGDTYCYVVVAIDTKGNVSGPSNVSQVTLSVSGFPVNPTTPITLTTAVQ